MGACFNYLSAMWMCSGCGSILVADGHGEQHGELSLCPLHVHQRQLSELIS